MSIFDKLNKPAAPTPAPAWEHREQTQTFTFSRLPESLAELKALPEAALDTPFQTAALTLCALCAYAADRQIGAEMLNWLRGPRPLSPYEISFLNDRFMDGRTYVPFSYFEGAVPANDYTPNTPFRVHITSNVTSNVTPGYYKLLLTSGGADSPRSLQLRMRGDGKWFLWEQFLLVDVRTPRSADPWA